MYSTWQHICPWPILSSDLSSITKENALHAKDRPITSKNVDVLEREKDRILQIVYWRLVVCMTKRSMAFIAARVDWLCVLIPDVFPPLFIETLFHTNSTVYFNSCTAVLTIDTSPCAVVFPNNYRFCVFKVVQYILKTLLWSYDTLWSIQKIWSIIKQMSYPKLSHTYLLHSFLHLTITKPNVFIRSMCTSSANLVSPLSPLCFRNMFCFFVILLSCLKWL